MECRYLIRIWSAKSKFSSFMECLEMREIKVQVLHPIVNKMRNSSVFR